MTKETIYLDLKLLSEEQLKRIPMICEKHSVDILAQFKALFSEGKYNEKMPFLFYWKNYDMFSCSFIRNKSLTEIAFDDFENVLLIPADEAVSEDAKTQELANQIVNILNEFELSTPEKLEILSNTRKKLENILN